MAKLAIAKASTNVTVYIFVQDSSATDGSGLTGLVFNSASLVCYYVRPLAAAAQLSLVTQTVTGAHADGGFVEVDATNMAGLYRLDLSDAVCATGVDSVVVMLSGATNMAPVTLEIQLTDVDLNDSVRGGMTALPNAAADAAGGLPISDAGALDLDALNTAAVRLTAARAQVLDDWINAGRLDLILDIIAADVVNLDGAAMRGTDNAALAATALTDVTWTDVRAGYLDELAAANIPADVDAILADTNELQTDDVPGLIAALNNISAADILTTQLTESYAADGAAPTLTQSLMMIQQILGDFSISGTTLTVLQVDGLTTAATFTLSDATNPTSLTRAT